MTNKAKVEQFLIREGIAAKLIERDKEALAFQNAMRSGLSQTTETELAMLPTWVPLVDRVSVNHPVFVLAVRGDGVTLACVTFEPAYDNLESVQKSRSQDFAATKVYAAPDQGTATSKETYQLDALEKKLRFGKVRSRILCKETSALPGQGERIDKQTFFGNLISILEAFVEKHEELPWPKQLCISFSFPIEILPDKDGVLLGWSKEVCIPDLLNERIGQGLKIEILKKGLEAPNIVIINNTVATLLAGVARINDWERAYNGYMGLILGSGTNLSYITSYENVLKDSSCTGEFRKKRMIINIESAGYTPYCLSELDNYVDGMTLIPNSHRLEKIISGRYMGLNLLFQLRAATKASLFSNYFAQNIDYFSEISPRDIEAFYKEPWGDSYFSQLCSNVSDREILYYIIDNLFERTASLLSAIISGVLEVTGEGKNPVRPVVISVNGSLLHKESVLIHKLDYAIRDYLNQQKSQYCKLVFVEDSDLIGSAIVSLTEFNE